MWRGGAQGESELLASCYRECLAIAGEKGLSSIAFPAISCGAYGFPLPAAAKIAIDTVFAFLQENTKLVVTFACFGKSVQEALDAALAAKVLERAEQG